MWQLHWRYTLWPHITSLGGGFKYVLCSPLPGEMIQFDLRIFFISGVFNHHLDQPSSMMNNRTQLIPKPSSQTSAFLRRNPAPRPRWWAPRFPSNPKPCDGWKSERRPLKIAIDRRAAELIGTCCGLVFVGWYHGFLAPHCAEKHLGKCCLIFVQPPSLVSKSKRRACRFGGGWKPSPVRSFFGRAICLAWESSISTKKN